MRTGDLIAIDRDRRASVVFHLTGSSADQLIGFDPALPAGRTLPQTSNRPAVELLANADVEPDADGDGFGDETQDNCPTIPNDQTTNPCAQTGQVAPTPGSGGPAQADTGEPTSGARVTVSRRHRRRHRPHGTTFHVPSADLG